MEKTCDLAVIGGGLAGFCAAVASARQGVSVILVQDRPVLGGNSSSEVRVPVGGACDFNPWARESGILEEFFLHERVQDVRRVWLGVIPSLWDMTLYSMAKKEKNLTVLLNTHIDEVETDSDHRIVSVSGLTLGNEKKVTIRAKYFIDATGDGSAAAKAGADFRFGREGKDEFQESLAPDKPDDFVMGSSLLFHAEDAGRRVPFSPPDWVPVFKTHEDFEHRTHDDITAGYWWIEIGNPPYHTIDDNEPIRDELYRQLLAVWDHIKNQDDHGADNLHIDFIGAVPGKRESRRIIGDYIMTEHDIRRDAGFPDAVAYGGWFCDLHTPGGMLNSHESPEPSFTSDPEEVDARQMYTYGIPLRSLYSRDVPNLFLAGRDISVTHVALGSTRLMATCAVIGQASGTAAAFCLKRGVTPRELVQEHIKELQQQLLKDDCYIPNIKNQDKGDLARMASVTASSEAVLRFPEGDIASEFEHPKQKHFDRSGLEIERAQMFPCTSGYIESIEVLLESVLDSEEAVQVSLFQSSSIIDFSMKKKLFSTSFAVQPHSKGYITVPMNVKVPENSLISVSLKSQKGVYWMYSSSPPAGTVSATRIVKNWKTQKGSYSLVLHPESHPYGVENVLSGVARPEEWTNIWISDSDAPLPAWIIYDFKKSVKLDTIYLTFDTNMNLAHMGVPGLYRAPECVKDYRLYGKQDGQWKVLAEVYDNYQRRCVHVLDSIVSVSELKLEILATNGAPAAGLFELRAYLHGERRIHE